MKELSIRSTERHSIYTSSLTKLLAFTHFVQLRHCSYLVEKYVNIVLVTRSCHDNRQASIVCRLTTLHPSWWNTSSSVVVLIKQLVVLNSRYTHGFSPVFPTLNYSLHFCIFVTTFYILLPYRTSCLLFPYSRN